MPQKTIRLSSSVLERLPKEARRRGHATVAAFLRKAITNELEGRQSAMDAAEERIAGTLERLARQIRRLETSQHAEFALIDALARVLLLCVPEPAAEIHAEALARAKQRHEKLLRVAALNMRGDARAALSNLVNHGD